MSARIRSAFVPHDLKAPIRRIENGLGLFLTEFSESLDANAMEYLDGIGANTKRMRSHIEDLLDFSRVSRSEIKPVEIDISSIVKAWRKKST